MSKKQEDPEMFIHMLTTNDNFLDLPNSLGIITPRKDINVEKSTNKIIARLAKTMANTLISISYQLRDMSFLNLFETSMQDQKDTIDYETIIDILKQHIYHLLIIMFYL